MKKNKLAAAIATLAAGSLLSLASISEASAAVWYNDFNAYDSNIGTDAGSGSTDGWLITHPQTGAAAGTWRGTSPFSFGYTGDVGHWAVQLGANGAQVISSQNAHDLYGVWADIDTAKGAWNDKGPNGPAALTGTSQGWGHNTDLGLFKSDVTQNITIKAASSSANPVITNFGISIFSGMTSANNYDHHGGWNINYRPSTHGNPNLSPAQANNPLSTENLAFLMFSDNSSITFTAQAGQIYTILLGGYGGAGIFGPHDGYQLKITSTTPVPVPAAAWLMFSGLMGFLGLGRKPGRQASNS